MFFQQRADFDYEVMAAQLSEHPYVNDCNFEKEKSKWENKLSAVGDVWKWCANDHLSPKDMGVRTNNNVATLFGYSKNGDGPPTAEGKQMKHAWAKITHGRTCELDGGDDDFKMLANLLCEICGFTFPFTGQFTQACQFENWQQPEYLTSAVGNILQSANGDI